MKCLETRKKDGMRWRRYRTDDGRIVTTYELPTTVLKGVAPPDKLRARLASFQRGEKTRERRAALLAKLAEGIKPLAIADELGMSTRQVQRLGAK